MAAISLRIWRNIFLLLAKQPCNYHRLKVDQGVGTRVREELNTRESVWPFALAGLTSDEQET